MVDIPDVVSNAGAAVDGGVDSSSDKDVAGLDVIVDVDSSLDGPGDAPSDASGDPKETDASVSDSSQDAVTTDADSGEEPPPNIVVVTPSKLDTMLSNPHVGLETWSAPKSDRPQLAPYPGVNIYGRIYWSTLEASDGVYDFSKIDEWITWAKAQHGHVGFRVVTSSSYGPRVPEWVKAAGCSVVPFDTNNWDIDWSNATCRSLHARLIQALGKRYDNNGVVHYVDIGSVSLWGGWEPHVGFSLPSTTIQHEIVDLYFSSFHSAYKIIPAEAPVLAYAVSKGAGVRADNAGGWNWYETDVYPSAFVTVSDAWKHAPIIGGPMTWFSDWGTNTSKTVSAVLGRHTSMFGWRNSSIKVGQDVELTRMVKGLGHRLVLTKLSYPKSVKAGATMHIATEWNNEGSAPPYWDYDIAFRWKGANDQQVVTTSQSIKGWLPGPRLVGLDLACPAGLSSGTYQLSLGVVEPGTTTPRIHLAIAGVDADGWYPLGDVSVP